MNNVKLYDHLLDIYNLSEDVYTSDEYLTLINDAKSRNNVLTEGKLMHIIFSKFIHDKEYIQDQHQKLLSFILRDDYINFYENEDLAANTVYFMDSMQSINMAPYRDQRIVDFDISTYASDTVRHYLFYLDVVAQIYNAAYDLKLRGLCCRPNLTGTSQYVLKARYMKNGIDNGYVLQLSQTDYEITLIIHRDNVESVIKDVTCMSTQSICAVFDIFKEDIKRHLGYLTGDDIYYTDLNYIRTTEYFYRLCRLKLMYLVAHSMRLLPYEEKQAIHTNFVEYITKDVLPVFTNFRDNMNVILLMGSENNSKSISYTKTVLERSSELADMNKRVASSKQKMLAYQAILKDFSDEYNASKNKHIVATILLCFVVLVSIFVFMLDWKMETKGLVSLAIVAVILVFMVILYTANNNAVIENFEDAPTKYPRYPATVQNEYYYPDGSRTQVRVRGSSLGNGSQYYYAIDNNDTTEWRGASGNYNATTGMKISGSDYLMLDLSEYIILNYYIIKVSNVNGAPKKFQLYGSNSNYAWNAADDTTKWELIDSKTSVSYTPASATIEVKNNNKEYRFYMIKIDQIYGSGGSAGVRGLEIYGDKQVSIATLTSRKVTVRGDATYVNFTAVPLPDDYSDNRLIDWSISISANRDSGQIGGEVKAYLDLSVGRFAFTNKATLSDTFEGIVSPLDPYDSQHITGIAVSTNGLSLTNVKYVLTVRYYPNVYDQDQERLITETDNIFTQVDDKKAERDEYQDLYKYYMGLYDLQHSTNVELKGIADSSNLYLQDIIGQINAVTGRTSVIDDLLSQISTSNSFLTSRITTSNLLREEYERKVRDVLKLTGDLSDLTQANNWYETTCNISGLRTTQQALFQSLEIYISASDKLQYANEQNVYASAAYERVLKKALEDKIVDLTSDIGLQEARKVLQEKTALSQQADANAQTAQLLLDRKNAEYQRDVKNELYKKVDGALTDYTTELSGLQGHYRDVDGYAQSARDQRILNESAASGTLATMNSTYGTNFKTMDEMNEYLQDRISGDKSSLAEINTEYQQLIINEQAASSAESKAKSLGALNLALAKETQTTIDAYNKVRIEAGRRRDKYLQEQPALQSSLQSAKSKSDNDKQTALDAYSQIDRDTQKIINEKRIERESIIIQIAAQYAQKFEMQKQEFIAKSNWDVWYKKLEEKRKEKEAAEAEKTYYKGLSDEIKGDVGDPASIYAMFQDMDIMIKYKINDNINGINYDLIVPSLNNEYHNFNIYKNTMQAYASKSEYDVNNLLLTIRETDAKTMLFLNICMTISLTMAIFYYLSIYVAGTVAIIAVIMAIVIYSIRIKKPVRTGSKYSYFGKAGV